MDEQTPSYVVLPHESYVFTPEEWAKAVETMAAMDPAFMASPTAARMAAQRDRRDAQKYRYFFDQWVKG